MSGLREKIVEALTELSPTAIYGDGTIKIVAEPVADAVLRVLAEHGDTQQVRAEIKRTIWEPERGENVSPVERVIAVVAPIVAARDAAAEELHALKTVIRMQDKITFELQADLAAANAQLERYDGQAWEDLRADLAAARQQLDQVRAAFQRWSGGPDNEFEQTMRDLLDAPARPAGHDESGQ